MTDRLPNLWCNRCMSLVREVEQNPDGTQTLCGKMLAIVDDDEPDAQDLLARLEAQAERIRELQVDAIDLNRLRRGLCEILCENIDSVDAVLCAVSNMRDELDERIRELEAERDRIRLDAAEARGNLEDATRQQIQVREDLRSRNRELGAERDQLREFARWAINASHFGVSDLCAEELQDKAIELGLLRVVPWDGFSPVDGDEDRMKPGDPVYVESDLLCGDEHA